MVRPLRVLCVEDDPADMELVLLELRRAGFAPEHTRVDDEPGFLAALERPFDVVLSDYVLPQFSGPRALELLRARDVEMPFLLISGMVGEDLAVASMRQGATDFLLKDRLGRLGEAVRQAIEKAELRREHLAAREAVTRLERQLESLFERSVEGVFRVSGEGRFSIANPALARMLGFETPAELLASGRGLFDVFEVPEERETFCRLLDRGEVVRGFETRLRRAGGGGLWVAVNAWPYRDERGAHGHEGHVEDVDRRRRALAALGDSEAVRRVILDTAPDGLVVLDEHGAILEYNPAAERLFGQPRAMAVGRPLEDLLGAGELQGKLPWSDAGGEDSGNDPVLGRRLEARCRRADGTEFAAEWSIQRIPVSTSRLYSCFIHDVTERKAHEERMAASLREKEALLQELHHRVKNNLQVISSMLELQVMRVEHPEAREVLQTACQRVRAMAQVHEALYMAENLAEVDVAQHLRFLLDNLVERVPGETPIDLELDLEPLRVDVETAVPLSLLVNELATNALQHAFRGRDRGRISVACRAVGDAVELIFSDDGIGLADTGEGASPRASLGLKLVRAMATQLDGELSVEAHEGTTFRLRFPWPRTT